MPLILKSEHNLGHLIPGGDDPTTSFTYTRLPSGTFLDIGSSPTSLYATWFLNKQFAIGPEFSFGRISVSQAYWEEEEETESITTLYLGGRAAFFLQSHLESSPYVLGRVSQTIFIDEDASFVDEGSALTGFGIGLGYQWRIGTAFVFRAEGQYQRLFLSQADDANEFSLTFGIGTRFGNSHPNAPEVPNAP